MNQGEPTSYRRWKKTHLYQRQFENENNPSVSNVKMDHHGPTAATAKQLEYIRMLEERNRLKKQMNENKNTRIEALERAFDTAFNGANSERFLNKKSMKRQPKSKLFQKRRPIASTHTLKGRHVTSAPSTRQKKVTIRRQWAKT